MQYMYWFGSVNDNQLFLNVFQCFDADASLFSKLKSSSN